MIKDKENYPPPLVPGLPVFGNLFQLKKRLLMFLSDQAKIMGPIYRFKILNIPITVISGKNIKNLVQNEEEFGLSRRLIFDAFSSEAGVDIFSVQGEKHKAMRAIIQLAYSRQITAQFVPEMEKSIIAHMDKFKVGNKIKFFELSAHLTTLSMMEVISPVKLNPYLKTVITFGNPIMNVVTKNKSPLAIWNPFYLFSKKRIYKALDEIIKRHEADEFKDHPQMFLIDALLKTKKDLGMDLPLRALRGGALYALCGTEIYIGRVVGFMMYEILKHPELKKNIKLEIDSAFGGKRRIDPSLFRKMPYLKATYLETLRLFPLLPGLPYIADRDFYFEGYNIPKGDHVVVSSFPEHFSEANFAKAEEFDVFRCMAPRNEHLKPGAFAPFGIGKRTCAAVGLTEVVTLTVISALLRDFDFEIDPNYLLKLHTMPLISPKDRMPVIYKGKLERKIIANEESFLQETSDFAISADIDSSQSVLPDTEVIKLEANTVIIKQGDEPDFFYIILEGSAEVIKDGEKVAELGEGRSFGELGLLKGVKRSATVRSVTEINLLRVKREYFINWSMECDLVSNELGLLLKKDFIKRSIQKALPGVQGETFELNTSKFKLKKYLKGEVIIKQGDAALHFYILTKGEVEVSVVNQGKKQILNRLESISFFGEMGILKRRTRNATITALTDVEVIDIERDDFLKIVQESHKTRDDLSLVVGKRLLTHIRN